MVTIAIIALAAFQLTRWMVDEIGPFRIFERLRKWADARGGQIALFVNCPYCLGFWFGALFYVLWPVWRFDWLITGLAIVSVHTLIRQISSRLDTYG